MSQTFAVIAGKLSSQAIRMMGLGLASNLPGKVSRKIDSSVLKHLAGQARRGVLAVSGTNGKSTSSGLLASILNQAGMKLVHNRQGANLVTGITACVVNAANWNGELDADYCLFEIDEAALPLIAKEVKIDHIIVTNLFRDQLDRFGELDTTARLIAAGVTQNMSSSILNADDPNVAQMVPDCPRLFYGIENLASSARSASNQLSPSSTSLPSKADPVANPAAAPSANPSGDPSSPDTLSSELSYCAKCGEEYSYSLKFYGQLGHYRCASCNNQRPQPSIYAEHVLVTATGSKFDLVDRRTNTRLEIELALPGMFNVYNALAASAMAFLLGIDQSAIKRGLCHYSTLFGRSERIKIGEKQVLIQLIKNPAGASQAVQAAAADRQGRYLIAINDNYADGRDVSWLWDAEFEHLSTNSGPFVVSGQRCHDMAVRLKYAGVDASLITVEPSLDLALDLALSKCGATETLWLMPTYTCLLDLQKIMKARGCPLAGT